MVRRFVQVGGAAMSPELVVYIFMTPKKPEIPPVENKNTHSLTLRITPEMDSLLSDAAHDARLSKSGLIRLAIQRCLKQKQQRHEAVLR
jgi:hypothetical protein